MRLFGIIFAAVGLIFLGVGVGLAVHQRHVITHAVSTEGKVLGTRIERVTSTDSDGRTSTSYRPVVEFSYRVDGRGYKGDRVHPTKMSMGHGWAQSIIAEYARGQGVEVFYLPAKPHKAFLRKEYQFFPYVFILFPMIFVSIGIHFAVRGRRTAQALDAIGDAAGWYALRPACSLRRRMILNWIVAGLWLFVGGGACLHFFFAAVAPYGLFAIIASAVYALALLVPLGMALHATYLRITVAEADVYIDQPDLRVGLEATLGLRQLIHASREIESVEVGLRCVADTRRQSGGKTQYSSEEIYELLEEVGSEQRTMAGETIEYAHVLVVPVGQPASSPPKYKPYPRYRWSVCVRVRIEKSPDYHAEFPILVRDEGVLA